MLFFLPTPGSDTIEQTFLQVSLKGEASSPFNEVNL